MANRETIISNEVNTLIDVIKMQKEKIDSKEEEIKQLRVQIQDLTDKLWKACSTNDI